MKPDILHELEQIRASNERHILMPAAVVNFARDENTALHAQFEWDDSVAAERWRLEQARGVIRVAVTIIGKGENQTSVPLYVSLTTDRENGGGYRAIHEVLTDHELQQQMLHDALQELETFRQKYQRLQALEPLWTAVDDVLEKQPIELAPKRGKRQTTGQSASA
jgi:hypothetical protein